MLVALQTDKSHLEQNQPLIQTAESTGVLVRRWQQSSSPAKATATEYPLLDDCVAEEVPIAMVYNGISHAVMLASPGHLEDFALGFSLAEGILRSREDLYGLEIVPQVDGIALEMEIASECMLSLKQRRRSMAGRTGCGLCGTENLAHAIRLPQQTLPVTGRYSPQAIQRAITALQSQQRLQAMTGATHACAWADRHGEVLLVREDVGRHNALDKLAGALAAQKMTVNEGQQGFVVTTSRASVEMVQKAYAMSASLLVAISAPTGLAVRIAETCGMTLVGFARPGQFVIYAHAERIGAEENK